MERAELYAILEVGYHQLERFFKAEASCVNAIVDAADGSPFWCHLLARIIVEQHLDGFRSFTEFLNIAEQIRLTAADVQRAVAVLPVHPDTQLFEDMYAASTLGDAVNEKTLLHIARRAERRYSVKSIIESAAKELGATRDEVRRSLVDMLKLDAGPFERGGSVGQVVPFAFRDALFRRYVLLRPGSQ